MKVVPDLLAIASVAEEKVAKVMVVVALHTGAVV